MDIQAIGAAATLALICAVVFLLAARSWQFLNRVLTRQPSFSDNVMSEAAQRFRDELQILSGKQASYLAAALVFIVIYAAASMFRGPQLFTGYPAWQLYALFAALIAAALLATYRLLRTTLARRQVRFLQDANIAIGHQLQRVAAEHGRAYHDVSTASGIVDHVLVGQSGIYAINVIARRHYRQATVRLENNELHFSNSERGLSVVDIAAASKRLARDLRAVTGSDVQVRSVIALPGWDIAEQSSEEHLLVNERTIAMIRGWKDQSDYLMNEDVALIQGELTRRCRRNPA
tara:strand:+ start:8025 stop:8894 length:870 start_codon:yes stop_codon:yes gene_type:complete